MAGGGGMVVRVWKEWGIQILVVASFLLQLVLLIFGGFRRRSSSAFLLAFLWLSYLMADNIAVYALGHMSLESKPRDAGLVAFWATFFLLHLGGQDTITAFSLEDNQLWRRHMLTLVVQASGAGYAIYRYTIPGTWTLVSATIVMFIVGFLKYGERVWALQRGNTDNLNFRKAPWDTCQRLVDILKSRAEMDREEVILLESHYMFAFCKGAFVDADRDDRFRTFERLQKPGPLPYKCDIGVYDLIEAELSLLYDLFYTKMQVVHTWLGYFIRAISLLGSVSALLLFCFDNGKGAYSRVDVSITYMLLVGAIILETTSVFSVVGSTWTCDYLHRQGWNRTNAMVMSLCRLFKVGSRRRWSHSIGQHNVLDYCARNQTKLTNMINKVIVLKEWWRKVGFSGNTKITVELKELVLAQIVRTMTADSKTWSIWDSQGRAVLTQYGLLDDICLPVEARDFADRIYMWHVATNIYLYFCNEQQYQSRHLNNDDDDGKQLIVAIKVLSNYMGFLLLHPRLLPNGVPLKSSALRHVEDAHRNGFTSKELARSLLDNHASRFGFGRCVPLAAELLENKRDVPMLQVIFGVWVELLCYAAHHSTHISHCGQLGRGGGFLTVIRLVVDHVELFQKCDIGLRTADDFHFDFDYYEGEIYD